MFGNHLGVPKIKHDLPTDNVTLWHVYKTSTVRPSTKHVSWEAGGKEMGSHIISYHVLPQMTIGQYW